MRRLSEIDFEHGWVARTTSGNLLLLGGFDPNVAKNDAATRKDGAVYNSTTNTWAPVPAWPSGHAHRYGAGVWMGTEFFLWGGEHGGVPTASGERLLP